MNSTPDLLRPPRMHLNLSVIRGHYDDANRAHTPAARGSAQRAAMRDIPALLAEIQRLWAVASEAHQRYTDLRAAALACIAASDAGEPDPMFYLRDELHAPMSQPPSPRGRR